MLSEYISRYFLTCISFLRTIIHSHIQGHFLTKFVPDPFWKVSLETHGPGRAGQGHLGPGHLGLTYVGLGTSGSGASGIPLKIQIGEFMKVDESCVLK